MRKCDFHKVAKQLSWNHILAWVLSCKFAAYFKNTISCEHLWTAASEYWPLVYFPKISLKDKSDIAMSTFLFH